MSQKEKTTNEKFVTTIKGELLPISKCRKYDSGFYKIGDLKIIDSGDCYLLNDNKYYRVETGQVVYDYSKKEYILKNSNLYFGYVDSDLNEGYFSNNKNSVYCINDNKNQFYCIDENIFNKNYQYREKLSDGIFYHITLLKADSFTKKRVPSNDYKTSLPYDSKNVIEKYVNFYENYQPEINLKYEKEIVKIIDNLSFGLEFETTKGFIPNNQLMKLALIPLRDGSITGIEYVTVPLKGIKGVCNVIDIVKQLKHRTDFDDRCALHLHLGNIPRDEMFITAFFKLTLGIQDELFSLFNLYKKYNFGYKNKNYSAPYDVFKFLSKMDPVINSSNIRNNFDVLFKHLTEGHSLSTYTGSGVKGLEAVTHHHKDSSGNQKWNIKERYHVHNFIPLIFGNKTTIEFRIHTPTYNINKIIWFLLFNSILINFTKENVDNILNNKITNYSLENIIIEHLSKIKISSTFISMLLSYFNHRKRRVEDFNRVSEIHFNEEKINCNINLIQKKNCTENNLDESSLIEKLHYITSSKNEKFNADQVIFSNYISYSDTKTFMDHIPKKIINNKEFNGNKLKY